MRSPPTSPWRRSNVSSSRRRQVSVWLAGSVMALYPLLLLAPGAADRRSHRPVAPQKVSRPLSSHPSLAEHRPEVASQASQDSVPGKVATHWSEAAVLPADPGSAGRNLRWSHDATSVPSHRKSVPRPIRLRESACRAGLLRWRRGWALLDPTLCRSGGGAATLGKGGGPWRHRP